MPEAQPTERRISRAQWGVLIIAIMSLIVAFTGVNFQSIYSYISETMFPKPDYIVESWTSPTQISSHFRESLSPSPEYYVVTSVNLKSDNPYQGDPMQFSISFENKGKKSVKQPKIQLRFADFLDRVWIVWNESVTDEILTEGCSFEYRFPSLDQKVVGDWSVFILLYDDAENLLVSYVLKQFTVTDIPAKLLWQTLLNILSVLVACLTLGVTAYIYLRVYWEDRVKKKKRAQKKKEG